MKKDGILRKILLGICMVLLIVMVDYGISYVVTVSIFALICMCFGVKFSWMYATGTWLIYLLLRKIFSNKTTINNNIKQ